MKGSGQDATLNMSYSEIIGPGHTLEDPSFTSGELGEIIIFGDAECALVCRPRTWRFLCCVVNVLVARMLTRQT